MSKSELVQGLNDDLAHEYAAVIQYLYQAATVPGLNRPALKEFFLSEIQDELRHAQFLAEKIASLGGNPTTNPASVNQTRDVLGMLKANLESEIATIERYKERLGQADKAGEVGLKVTLEDFIADETRHKEELERLLKDSSALVGV